MKVPRAGRRERRRRATREMLLRSALALIAERGVYAARVEDITRRADVAKGVFYLHFVSKSHLLAELLSEGIRSLERSYVDALATEETPRGRIRLLVRAHAAFFQRERAHALLFHQARGLQMLGTERDGSVTEIFGRYLRDIGASVVAERALGGWSREDLARLGAVVVGSVSGYQSYERSAGLEPSGDGILDGVADAAAVFMDHVSRAGHVPRGGGTSD